MACEKHGYTNNTLCPACDQEVIDKALNDAWRNAMLLEPEEQRDEEAESLRRDAERLRFLLRWKMGYAPGGYECLCARCVGKHVADKRAVICKECADSAIDAAMKEEGK